MINKNEINNENQAYWNEKLYKIAKLTIAVMLAIAVFQYITDKPNSNYKSQVKNNSSYNTSVVQQPITVTGGNAYSNGGNAVSNTRIVNNIVDNSVVGGNNSLNIGGSSNSIVINNSTMGNGVKNKMQKMQIDLEKQNKEFERKMKKTMQNIENKLNF